MIVGSTLSEHTLTSAMLRQGLLPVRGNPVHRRHPACRFGNSREAIVHGTAPRVGAPLPTLRPHCHVSECQNLVSIERRRCIVHAEELPKGGGAIACSFVPERPNRFGSADDCGCGNRTEVSSVE
jgi:hypothetical protein